MLRNIPQLTWIYNARNRYKALPLMFPCGGAFVDRESCDCRVKKILVFVFLNEYNKL